VNGENIHMHFEDLRVDPLKVLSQHSYGENEEKCGKPQSGYLMSPIPQRGSEGDYAPLYSKCQFI
jgi:hypothetical protein